MERLSATWGDEHKMPVQIDPAFKLVDAAEAQTILRIGKSKLQRLVREKKLHRSAVSTGRMLFTMGELQRLISTPLEQVEAA
jgi:hypothetical protein